MRSGDGLGKEAAIETIIRFVKSLEPAPIWSEWYIGTTDEPKRKLEQEHKASRTKSVIVSVGYVATARAVEEYLINRYGMDGAPGEKEHPLFVYAFKKSANTTPPLRSTS